MPRHERRHFDSREAIERKMLGGLGGFTLFSVLYFHPMDVHYEAGTGLAPRDPSRSMTEILCSQRASILVVI